MTVDYDAETLAISGTPFEPNCMSGTEMAAAVIVLVGILSATFIFLGLCFNIEPHKIKLKCKGGDDGDNDSDGYDIDTEQIPLQFEKPPVPAVVPAPAIQAIRRNRNSLVQSIERNDIHQFQKYVHEVPSLPPDHDSHFSTYL